MHCLGKVDVSRDTACIMICSRVGVQRGWVGTGDVRRREELELCGQQGALGAAGVVQADCWLMQPWQPQHAAARGSLLAHLGVAQHEGKVRTLAADPDDPPASAAPVGCCVG